MITFPIAITIFLTFSVLETYVVIKCKNFMDKSAKIFLIAYTTLFFFKSVIELLRLIYFNDNLYNEEAPFKWRWIVALLEYFFDRLTIIVTLTFSLHMREVVIKVTSDSVEEYQRQLSRHREVKIIVYVIASLLMSILIVFKGLL